MDAYLLGLVARLEARLGGRLLGAWLVGSSALGDFDAARSDVDVQAVSAAALARPELEQLAAELSHEALACPARGLEFVLYAREALADPRGPAFQLNLNTGSAIEHHAGYDADAEPRFWFVLDVSVARQRARRLAGATADELLPELPRPLVLSALRDALAWYRDRDGAQAVLASCRACAWANDGWWRSKGDAARWAIARCPEDAPVIVKALDHRRDTSAPGPTRSEASRFVSAAERVLAN